MCQWAPQPTSTLSPPLAVGYMRETAQREVHPRHPSPMGTMRKRSVLISANDRQQVRAERVVRAVWTLRPTHLRTEARLYLVPFSLDVSAPVRSWQRTRRMGRRPAHGLVMRGAASLGGCAVCVRCRCVRLEASTSSALYFRANAYQRLSTSRTLASWIATSVYSFMPL